MPKNELLQSITRPRIYKTSTVSEAQEYITNMAPKAVRQAKPCKNLLLNSQLRNSIRKNKPHGRKVLHLCAISKTPKGQLVSLKSKYNNRLALHTFQKMELKKKMNFFSTRKELGLHPLTHNESCGERQNNKLNAV